MGELNRRVFLQTISAGTLAAQARTEQSFLAGLAPSMGGQQVSRIDAFWRACDECSKLGLHYLEVNTTHTPIVDTYTDRLSEFQDEMKKRNLTMLGLALYTHMHEVGERRELVEAHLRVARFLKAVGGRYITQLLAPGPNLGNAEDGFYRQVDVKAFVGNANEVGKAVRERTGVRVGYHPEQGDIRAGIYDRILDGTDPRYFDFMPDVGHLAAAGKDPLQVYKTYRSRIIGTHFKDFNPEAEFERNGQRMKGRMVPFGQGVVKMPALIQFLKETKFTGHVMGEGGGGNQAMRDYMVNTLGLTL